MDRSTYSGRGRPKDPELDERTVAMAALYRSGLSLREIGERYGVSHERVRQCIKRFGVTRIDRGVTEETAARRAYSSAQRDIQAANRAERRDRQDREIYGCARAEIFALSGATGLGDAAPFSYRVQRQNAGQRGIEWNLTFPQWWSVWVRSGKWEQRGCHKGEFVMSRLHDAGAYEVGNVRIATCTENLKEYYFVTKKLRQQGLAAQ